MKPYVHVMLFDHSPVVRALAMHTDVFQCCSQPVAPCSSLPQGQCSSLHPIPEAATLWSQASFLFNLIIFCLQCCLTYILSSLLRATALTINLLYYVLGKAAPQ